MGLLTYGESGGMPNTGGLLDNPNMQLMLAGLTMMANKRGPNAQNAIPMGLNQFMQMQNNSQQNEMRKQQQEMQRQQFDMQKQEFDMKKAQIAAQQDQERKRRELFSRLPEQLGINPDILAAYPQIGEDLIKRQFAPQEIKAYKPGDVLYQGGKQIGAIPSQEDLNPNKPFMVVDGQIVPNKAYQDYEFTKAEKGRAQNNVNVSTGQKGFDNTLKLRGDFRSEPIYKAHQEVKAAYAQIGAALKKNSPAGDLAGATKIMKLLDPGSVVRESELGMAMAASGALDRLTNYADMTIRGTKLTPEQRKDFQGLADSLFAESANQYNAKRGEYEGIAQRNELNVPDVVGGAEQVPTKVKAPTKGLMKGQKVNGYKYLGGNPNDPASWSK